MHFLSHAEIRLSKQNMPKSEVLFVTIATRDQAAGSSPFDFCRHCREKRVKVQMWAGGGGRAKVAETCSDVISTGVTFDGL